LLQLSKSTTVEDITESVREVLKTPTLRKLSREEKSNEKLKKCKITPCEIVEADQVMYKLTVT